MSTKEKVEMVHGLIHDACFDISQGQTDAAKEKLSEADLLTHELCEEVK